MKSRPDFTVYNNLSSRFIPGMSALRIMVDDAENYVSECPAYKLARSNRCSYGMGPESCDHLTEAIAHLNDTHGWTFDEIANWSEESELNVKLPDRNFVIN